MRRLASLTISVVIGAPMRHTTRTGIVAGGEAKPEAALCAVAAAGKDGAEAPGKVKFAIGIRTLLK